jgi:sarcosine oxidase, subunit beta
VGSVLLANAGDQVENTTGKNCGVVTDQGSVAAPVVIAATGPWTRPLLLQTGYDLPIECEYHQVAILRNASDMKGGGCACIDSVTATYFRSDTHDKFLVGDFLWETAR